MSKDFRIISNWPIIHGDINKSVDAKYINNFTSGTTKRDDISDIISDDNIVLLENDGTREEKCELTLNIKPTFYIHSIVIISNHSVIELFKGNLQEYYKTIQGDFIADYDGTKTYRIDMQFTSKNLTAVTIKFMTSLNEPIWLFGMQIVLAENKNFLQNILQSSATGGPVLNATALIDIKNVQGRLSESNVEISKNAAKCKELIEGYTKLMSSAKLLSNNNATSNLPNFDDHLNGNSQSNGSAMDATIKSYIDSKFDEFETRMNDRFDRLTDVCNQKLDNITNLLEGFNKK